MKKKYDLSLLGVNLKKFREKKGMTQSDLSKKTKIEQANISRYETNPPKTMELATACSLAEALEVSLMDLLGIDASQNIVSPELAKEAEAFSRVKNMPLEKIIADALAYQNSKSASSAESAVLKRLDELEAHKLKTDAEINDLKIKAARCDELELQNQKLLKIITDVEAGIIRVTQIKKYIENSKFKY
ncbi:MAG TPA: helix-turn-helix transcriptional regulator [bacterium]|nr:helix-turn-helix transcriptional regulator [bacterium]HPN31362.1 helix-turn-helix transcriptional regulator [bacterium]